MTRSWWLMGWPRIGDSVLIGTGVHCVGCGQLQGITTVAFTGSLWERVWSRRSEPLWPFDEEGCPVHSYWYDGDRLDKAAKPAGWPRGKPRPLP